MVDRIISELIGRWQVQEFYCDVVWRVLWLTENSGTQVLIDVDGQERPEQGEETLPVLKQMLLAGNTWS